MTTKQKPDRLDKRAAALRDNLRKRKALKKAVNSKTKKNDKDSKD